MSWGRLNQCLGEFAAVLRNRLPVVWNLLCSTGLQLLLIMLCLGRAAVFALFLGFEGFGAASQVPLSTCTGLPLFGLVLKSVSTVRRLILTRLSRGSRVAWAVHAAVDRVIMQITRYERSTLIGKDERLHV